MSKSSKSKLKCPKCVNYSVGYYRTYQGITTYANKCYNIHAINFHNVPFKMAKLIFGNIFIHNLNTKH